MLYLNCNRFPFAAIYFFCTRHKIEGEAEIRIFYKSATDEKISCISVLKEFSYTVAVNEPDVEYDILTKTTASVNSVRTSGPRKISVKAEITTTIFAAKKLSVQVTETVSDCIEARKEKISVLSGAEWKERELRITEELELPDSAAPVWTLLYTEAAISAAEVTVSRDRCVLKGELSVKPVYVSADGDIPKSAEFKFPVNQIIEIAGLDEEYICDATLKSSAYMPSRNLYRTRPSRCRLRIIRSRGCSYGRLRRI